MRTSLALATALLAFPILGNAEDQAADLAKQPSNPVASLISVPFQANYDFGMGPTNDGYKFMLNYQPVIPISIGRARQSSNEVCAVSAAYGAAPAT